MAQLMRLKGIKWRFQTITLDWKQVGFHIDLDPNGRKIRSIAIEAEHAHRLNGPVVCCHELFVLWLESPDATWGNLTELLNVSEYEELAEQIKNAPGP